MLQNAYLDVKIGVDTAENRPPGEARDLAREEVDFDAVAHARQKANLHKALSMLTPGALSIPRHITLF